MKKSDVKESYGFLQWLKTRGLRIYAVACLCLVFFAGGVAVVTFRIFPYELMKGVAAAGVDVIRYPRHRFRIEPEKFYAESRHEGEHVARYNGDKTSPGTTFLVGFFDGFTGMRLVGLDGRLIHEWRVSFNEIWPDASHLDRQPHDWDTEIHGALLYPNGDIVFNFQYSGLVRIDRCSRVKWRLARKTHHSISQDGEGNLWVPGRVSRENVNKRFPGIVPPFLEEYLLKIAPDGTVLKEISVLEAIYGSEYEGVLFANGLHRTKVAQLPGEDFTHMNDIEVLKADLAAAFPAFEAGDLLVSLRNLNLLILMSPETRRIKRSWVGPFHRQHDPDFLSTGRISVFDNRRDNQSGGGFGGSLIREIDPADGTSVTTFGSEEGEFFYSDTMGEHQWLPNGNLLITESTAGHVFEVNTDREIVWSYVNRWIDGSVATLSQATRYPEHYLSSSVPRGRCDG